MPRIASGASGASDETVLAHGQETGALALDGIERQREIGRGGTVRSRALSL